MEKNNLGFYYLQQAKASHAVGNLIVAKENATAAAQWFKTIPEFLFEYLDAITLLQTIASIQGNMEDYLSLEPQVKSVIFQIFQDKASYYYALHQYDTADFYLNRGMLIDASLLITKAHTTLLEAYGELTIILYHYHYYRSRYLYKREDYYDCIDSCLITNDLWIRLDEKEEEDYEDNFLSMLHQNRNHITRMGILNVILLASSYGKLNNSEVGIQILDNIRYVEELDYYLRSAIDLNLAELYARNHNYSEARRLLEPYKNSDYSNYPELATCVDTILFAMNYSGGLNKEYPLRLPWVAKISDYISNDYLKVHRFNLAVALASQGQYEKSLTLSYSIGNKGLSLQMALFHELNYFDKLHDNFPTVKQYYLREIENIFSHYNESLVYNHLETLEYHVSLCLGSLFSEDLKRSKFSITGEQLYDFYLNTKGISLEGSYILRHYPDDLARKERKPTNVSDLQKKIDSDSLLLEYALVRTLNEAYYGVFLIGSNTVDYLQLGSEAEMNELLGNYQDYLQDCSQHQFSPMEINDLNTKLRRSLILPIKKYLNGIHRLIIAPVGDLYYIPFELLMTNSTEEIGSLYPITYLNIGRELALIASPYDDIDLSHSLIIGNSQVSKLPTLPFAALETQYTGDLLHAPVHHGEKASIDLLYRDRIMSPILHIAVHGFFHETIKCSGTETTTISDCNPMKECGLYLADEYSLNAEEISTLQLSSVRLCILSACYSGLGKSKGNEGSFGLRRGFFLAGCHNLLISLWSIHDFSGMLLIKCFMDGLIINHLNTFEALQTAKLIMRTRTIKEWKYYWQELLAITDSDILLDTIQTYFYQNDDYIPFAHPYYWAGFQLIGNPVSFV